MLVSEAIQYIRDKTDDNYDTGYSERVLIRYINDAIKYLAGALITRYDPLVCNDLVVDNTGTTPVPKNFVRFAGGFPVKKHGNVFEIVDGSTTVNVRYFYMPDDLVNTTDSLPFTDIEHYDMVIVNLATVYALNQHEFNVNQDSTLKAQLEDIITQALGAV